VPSVCRRIAALFVVACLGVAAPVTPALAQGAGDQQYQDPFGDSGSGSSGSGSSKPKTQTSPSGNLEPLSPAPQTSGSGSGSGSGSTGSTTGSSSAGTTGTGTGTSTAAPSAPATGNLPNTGLDTRVLLLGGAVLLLLGLGLRLRSAPERF
jgi:LPXTG-motif cell wall-anchored protein